MTEFDICKSQTVSRVYKNNQLVVLSTTGLPNLNYGETLGEK